MKNIFQSKTQAIAIAIALMIINSCSKEQSSPTSSVTFNPLSGALIGPDHTIYNH